MDLCVGCELNSHFRPRYPLGAEAPSLEVVPLPAGWARAEARSQGPQGPQGPQGSRPPSQAGAMPPASSRPYYYRTADAGGGGGGSSGGGSSGGGSSGGGAELAPEPGAEAGAEAGVATWQRPTRDLPPAAHPTVRLDTFLRAKVRRLTLFLSTSLSPIFFSRKNLMSY